MPVSISDYLGIDKEAFDATGAFDAVLDIDTNLFIDPFLLRSTEAPELKSSYEKIQKRYSDILKLLAESENTGDVFWRQAWRLFQFGEMKGLCIGYSSSGTSGSGMGKKLRRQVLQTAKKIVDAGIKAPEFFELLGVFEEGVGADRISDMIGWIILEDLYAYSERVFGEFEVQTFRVTYKERVYYLPRNKFNGYPIILIPCDILRDLPTANSWDGIGYVIAENQTLRQKVNELVGRVWAEARKQLTKAQIRSIFLDYPDLLQEVIKAYKGLPAVRYDFDKDPADQIVWYLAARRFVKENPLELSLPRLATPEDVLRVVRVICGKFKDLVENNQLYTILYRDDDRREPRKEETAQKLFYAVADSYCEANNLDLSRETNAGRGPVDFKLSAGYHSRVLVEVKLTTNPYMLHGFEVQVGEYQKAEKTEYAIYLVIDVGGSRERIADLRKAEEHFKIEGKRMPETIFVNAQPKLSASRYRRRARKRH